MRRLPLLKTLTNILFFLSMLAMIFAIPFSLIAVIMPEEVPMPIDGRYAKDMQVEDYLYYAAGIVACGFWTYALHLFKSVLGYYEKRQFFHDKVILLLNQAGMAILIGLFINLCAEILYNTIIVGEFSFGISTERLFTLILGLFLIVLSEVFSMAKRLKEENDLTV